MNRPFAALTALAGLAVLAAPAAANEERSNYSMRTSLEFHNWNWSNAAGTSLTYASPMTVFTVMDHTGGVLGAVNTVAANEARRREAEREAIRKDQRTYSWQVEEATPAEGTRLGFSVGQGGVMGPTSGAGVPDISGTTNITRFGKLFVEGDLFALAGGVFVFETGTAYWSTLALPAGTPYTPAARGNTLEIEAWNWPLALRYRYRNPLLPGFTLEPMASFDWLYTLAGGVNGNWRFDARNFGVEAGYQPLPAVRLRAGYYLNTLAHNAVPWMKTEEMVSMQNATLGATLFF